MLSPGIGVLFGGAFYMVFPRRLTWRSLLYALSSIRCVVWRSFLYALSSKANCLLRVSAIELELNLESKTARVRSREQAS